MNTQIIETSDPKIHAMNIESMLNEMVDHLRGDLKLVKEPKAQALFETGAEVLIGLRTAFQHYRQGAEPAMA